MPLWPNGFLTKRVVRAPLPFQKFVEITQSEKKGRQATVYRPLLSDVQKDPHPTFRRVDEGCRCVREWRWRNTLFLLE